MVVSNSVWQLPEIDVGTAYVVGTPVKTETQLMSGKALRKCRHTQGSCDSWGSQFGYDVVCRVDPCGVGFAVGATLPHRFAGVSMEASSEPQPPRNPCRSIWQRLRLAGPRKQHSGELPVGALKRSLECVCVWIELNP